jgi:predicted transcriptional regulator
VVQWRAETVQRPETRFQNAEAGVDREAGLSYIVLHMKSSTLTIRLDPDLDRLLTKASRRSGRNRSQVAREALRRQLRISQFERLRQRVMPFAEARGFLTDEDVFAEIS